MFTPKMHEAEINVPIAAAIPTSDTHQRNQRKSVV